MRARARTYLFLGFDVLFVGHPRALVAIVTGAGHAMARAAPTAADVERDRELRALIVAAASQPHHNHRSHRHRIASHHTSHRNRTAPHRTTHHSTQSAMRRCAGREWYVQKLWETAFGQCLVTFDATAHRISTTPQFSMHTANHCIAALTALRRTSADLPRLRPAPRSL